jgi:hypothetical protein
MNSLDIFTVTCKGPCTPDRAQGYLSFGARSNPSGFRSHCPLGEVGPRTSLKIVLPVSDKDVEVLRVWGAASRFQVSYHGDVDLAVVSSALSRMVMGSFSDGHMRHH